MMASDQFTSSLDLIKKNDPNEVKIVCETLLRILSNIQKSPTEAKLRKLSLESDDVLYNLMPYEGALEALFVIGFEENDDCFQLPVSVKPDELNSFILKIQAVLDDMNKSKSDQSSCSKPKPEEKAANKLCASTNLVKSNNNQALNAHFASRLASSYEHVMLYEDPNLKRKALNVIPVEELKSRARAKLEAYKSSTSLDTEPSPLDFDDFLLLELLAWFKNEFFTWTNQPECRVCGTCQNMRFIRSDRPNRDEIAGMAGNVEVYECQTCKSIARFPRYNHPGKLLETRTGRCGEWANCFCLCARALDLDTRYVLDWTDHVWCEVYSRSQRRWLHADPCENAADKPLMYEVGWTKKLSYVIAFSRNECIDVTWRYTMNQEEVMKRRNECNEMWLVSYTNQLTARRQESLSKREREELQKIKLAELLEFMSPKKVKEGEDLGRQSGSLEWRLSRGEFQTKPITPSFQFKLIPSEKNKRIEIRYNTAKDTYYTIIDGSESAIKNWSAATYRYSNIQMKIEHDWKMCYLARTNGSEKSLIEWYFEIGNSLKDIDIKFDYKCFENGEIRVFVDFIKEDSSSETIELADKKTGLNDAVKCSLSNGRFVLDLSGPIPKLVGVKLRAEMSKGRGENAWQHTQLFRQALNDSTNYLFDVVFNFL